DFKHNPESYRYCIIDVPGNSREEIMLKYENVVTMLGYKFDIVNKNSRLAAKTPGRPPEITKGGAQELSMQPPVTF
ncbi:MAG: hypothetical protein U9N77_11715, partial [Thermodesulfobacteriota bacterium]|nr:hypothetical protein [Thermodesulfobacteriota bacterium]